MTVSGLSWVQVSILGAVVVLGAAAGTALLLAAGPWASDDEPGSAATATTTSTAGATATVPSPTVTATATGVPSASPSAVSTATEGTGKADEWPEVTCGEGTHAIRAKTRRISICAPDGDFVFTDDEWDGTGGRPPGEFKHILSWYHRTEYGYFMGLQVITREGSSVTVDSLRAPCATGEPSGTAQESTTTLLGHEAVRCVWMSGDAGRPVIGNNLWGIEVFVELPDYWLIANAAGPQFGAERDAAFGIASAMIESATANGLERIP